MPKRIGVNSTKRGAPRARAGGGDVPAIADTFRKIVQALRLSASAAEQRLGVSGAQHFLLALVAELPGQSINELAARTLTRQSTVSVVVTRLAERGLVTRQRATDDGRRSVVNLTAAGRALLRRAPNPAQERLFDALRVLSPADARALRRILHRVATTMGVAHDQALLFFQPMDAPRGRR